MALFRLRRSQSAVSLRRGRQSSELFAVGAAADRDFLWFDLRLIGDIAAMASAVDFHDPALLRLHAFGILVPGACRRTDGAVAVERDIEDTVRMLFWALMASAQVNMRKVDGWRNLSEKP